MITISAEQARVRVTRSPVTLATYAITIAGVIVKARKAKNSTDLLDHADIIAWSTSLAVLLLRARRGGASGPGGHEHGSPS